jgi:CheY-like chemotaxis protein
MMNHTDGHNSPVVLIVEDEYLVRMTLADELEDGGFQVLKAANADIALRVLEAQSDTVQVLFTDVDLPGSMDGMELARQVRARWPHVQLLISSGHSAPEPDQMPNQSRFVQKPYIGPTVVRQIREMMSTSAS